VKTFNPLPHKAFSLLEVLVAIALSALILMVFIGLWVSSLKIWAKEANRQHKALEANHTLIKQMELVEF
jgi:prepilin-type N-terminal cleavage/methylation domain-containing protein